MLDTMKSMRGYKLNSLDGEIGKVEEFYFDDHYWTLRYLVADLGLWLSDREVLISPYALAEVNNDKGFIAVNLTKKQIEHCPPLGIHKPVSRQYEESYLEYYGWPAYWDGPYSWGRYPNLTRGPENRDPDGPPKEQWDSHLRSSRDMTGHSVQATDGEVGHVADFILDDETWTIRYLVVDTTSWWPGKQVLVSPCWTSKVDWAESKVFVDLTRAAIQKSPEYNELTRLDRAYEAGVHLHYHQTGYWDEELAAKEDFLVAPGQKGDLPT